MGVKEYKFADDDRHLLNEYHRQLDSLGEWQINFTPDTKHQTYAFDRLGSGNHGIFATDEYYPKSGNYDFRYKSVECGKTDRVVVDFGSYSEKDSVIFKDKYGVTLKVVDKNILIFTGVSNADTNFIYAYRGDKKIGKLFLNTYQQKTYKVVFVRVNGAAKKLNAQEITKYLNKVYNQCAVSFEDSIDNITIGNLTSFSHGGSGNLTVYNDDQKKVLSAYEKEKKMTDGVFYLFFIDNVTDKKDGSGTPVSGYMPRGYNAGFIYDGGSEHTIAHELGHGVAGLEHVFENSSNSGKTANLMDYANGEELWHFQWDMLQDPARKIFKWWQNESGSEDISTSKMVCLNDEKALEIINQYRDFYLPDKTNTVVHLDKQNYYASGFIICDDKTEDGVETIGSLAGIRYLGGDYILHYTNVSKEPSVFRYEMSKNQYSTLLNVNDLPKGDNSLAVRVRIDTKSHRLTVERQNSIIQNIELTNNDYTCKQPPAIALPKYYFEVQEVEPTNKDFIVVNDIAKDDIVNMFVSKIKDNPHKYLDDNISNELKDTISYYQDNYHLIVKFIQIDKLSYNQESWQQLAKKVYKQLQIDKSIDIGNKLLITIPYVKVTDQYFYMPGLYYGNNVLFNDKLPNTYKNISNKNTFTIEDADESLIKFLCDVYKNLFKLKELEDLKNNQTKYDFEAFDNAANQIHKELLELHNRPNLKKPKIKIWIDEERLDHRVNPNTLKEYIQYAFDNCFEDDNTVDFKLGYDLEFINGPEKNNEYDIVACFTQYLYLQKLYPGSYSPPDGLHGCTPIGTYDPSPIFLDGEQRDSDDYYFMVFYTFHEICHRITFRGGGYLTYEYFGYEKTSPTGKDDCHDKFGLVASGQIYSDQAGIHLTKEEMKTLGTFNIANALRRYVMYNALLYNFNEYNN